MRRANYIGEDGKASLSPLFLRLLFLLLRRRRFPRRRGFIKFFCHFAAGNPRNKVALRPGFSLMDWIRLTKSGKDLAGTNGKVLQVTPKELAKHNKRKDAWMAINGKKSKLLFLLCCGPISTDVHHFNVALTYPNTDRNIAGLYYESVGSLLGRKSLQCDCVYGLSSGWMG
jgi:hypothetical protein